MRPILPVSPIAGESKTGIRPYLRSADHPRIMRLRTVGILKLRRAVISSGWNMV